MCGICGIIDFGEKIIQDERSATVQEQNAAIVHRGPDSAGFYSDTYCSLAMRRLSIIDLETGDQPFWNEDRTVCVFMNGEIYNYQELKSNLIELGHQFYSKSDTEVLVHLYEEYGESLSDKLIGMFAFCVYDISNETCIISRDRFGEKPLYYHYEDEVMTYSSEVNSLLQNHRIKRKLDHTSLEYYLTSAYVPEPLTLIEGVKVLPAGKYLKIQKNSFEEKTYFSIDYKSNPKISNEQEAIEHIKPKLENAIRRQAVSDVPLGAFLSGGIDSSTVCTLLQKEMNTPLNTFTVRFEESSYDESKIAKEVSEKIGSNHTEITVPNGQFSEEIFWKIIDHVGLPFPDSSAIPSYLLTKEISKHVKVAISGDGGDEIFAGYPVFGWWSELHKLTKIPNLLSNILRESASLGTNFINHNKLRQFNRALEASKYGDRGISYGISRLFLDSEYKKICNRGIDLTNNIFFEVPDNYNDLSDLRKSMYFRLRHNLRTDMLIKVDRMSMANSLEVRAPFLDSDLYEASLDISDDLLYKNNIGKKIIRSMMTESLPDSVFNHPKSGFSIPLHMYFNDEFKGLCKELIFENKTILELFDKEELHNVYRRGLSIKDKGRYTAYRSSHQLWSLLLLGGWIKRFSIEA